MNELKITRIDITKQERYALFVKPFDKEEFLFSIDENTLIKYNIKVGSLLSGEELMVIKQKSDGEKAKNKAMQYLSIRDHSIKELRTKLFKKFDADSVNYAISEMERLNYVNDENFAKHRVEYLIKKGKSKGDIISKLYELGIDRYIIDDLSENIFIDEEALIKKLVEKSYVTKLQQGKKQNVIAAFMRKGFSLENIKNVLKDYEEEWEYNDY